MTYAERKKQSSGVRKRFKGKMGIARKSMKGSKTVVVMRSHTGSTKPTRAGWESGQNEPYPTKNLPGQFKVPAPKRTIRGYN